MAEKGRVSSHKTLAGLLLAASLLPSFSIRMRYH